MPVLDPPPSGARVRMYRPGGLGDSFLLAFRARDETARYVLVDCGVFNGTPGGADRLRAIAEDVREATDGHLHVLVVTHEHWDHLSGFRFAREVFESLRIDEVWTAWTEDPADPDAVRLQRERDAAFGAVVAAVRRMRAAPGLDHQADEIAGLLDFVGEPNAEPLAPPRFPSERRVRGTADQMDFALSLGDSVRYLTPDDAPLALDGVDGLSVFVLGPPRGDDLRRSDPRAGEVYGHALVPGPEGSAPLDFAAAVRDGDGGGPFAPSVGVPLAMLLPGGGGHDAPTDIGLARFFDARYGTKNEAGQGAAWRRIDADWLAAAEPLALRLDHDTNNTSLVLAFELDDGRVLLFPGDAQVGNWLSWHGLSWTVGARVVTGTDLVRRTALYKVGHHASHNATLRDRGLELMARPDLVALVPVDAEQAARKSWAMPFGPLLDRLSAKCAGRVIRADEGVPPRPPGAQTPEWDAFLARTVEDPDGLWVQIDVPGGDAPGA